LSGWWLGSSPVDTADVSTVLALDEFGRASAWVQDYGGPPGTGFVRVWGRPEAMDDLSGLRAVAEYGLE
jgi:hypothetical protein